MRNLLMILLAAFMMYGTVYGVEIQDVSVYDYSSYYYGSRYDFYPDYVINGDGLDPETEYHTSDRYEYAYWMNGIGTKVSNGDQYITIKLDPIDWYLTEIQVWNFNRNGYTSRGVQEVEILVSESGSGPYTSLGTFTLERAPGDPDYTGETIPISYASPVRFVKFALVSTYGDASYAGFSELKFYGNGVSNEPPYVFAGKPMQIQGLSTTLSGDVTDDGNTPTIEWYKISGPGTVDFNDSSDPCTAVTFSDYGLYELELNADDSTHTVYSSTTVRCIPEWWNDLNEVSIDSSSGSFSSYYTEENIIDGSGLLFGTGYHSSASYYRHWCSDSSPSSSWIIFDLGTTAALDGVRIWNFNHSYPGYLEGSAASSVNVSVSNDKDNWENLGSFSMDNPLDFPWDTSKIFALSPSQSYQYIKFDDFSNYGGSEVGLSEVRFSGVKDNLPPDVTAGADVDTWLDPNQAIVTLDATATDDGQPDPPGELNYTWTKISGPNDFSFDSNVIEDPTITFTEVGAYEFQVDVNDTELSATDTVLITVYENGCSHAQAQPDYEPIDGDVNGDCRVDMLDLALFVDTWLDCSSSDPADCL